MLLTNHSGRILEAGVDEAGRGCLAGPVVAAAVILPPDYTHTLLNDSKQLNRKQREALREVIFKDAVCWSVAEATPEEIDKINILQATFLAMHRAIEKLQHQPEHLIIDGNRFKSYQQIPSDCIIKGDGKYLSIAAASVLAKTFRDDYMAQLSEQYAMYGWNQNAGYPTRQHRQAIEIHGPTEYHRMSFALLPRQLSLI